MSLYKKFKKRMEDEMRHHTNADDVIHVWGLFMSMMGETNFNEMLAPYFKPEKDHWQNSGEAFYAFHKGMRQGDTFDCFVRTKEVSIPDEEGKRKGRTKSVIDEHINGEIESLIWTMIHLDKNDAFQKTFKFYWDLYQKEVPVVEFVFEKKSDKSWDDNYNGLVGVRFVGSEEFIDKEIFDELFPGMEGLSFLVEHGMQKYRWNKGLENKPEDATNYAALEYPIYESSRTIEDIISWESRTETPFKFIQTTVLPKIQEA